MDAAVLDNFTAVAHIANGNGVYHKTVVLSGVLWKEYEEFLRDFEDKAGKRLTYDNGKLKFIPPLKEYEEPSRMIHDFVRFYCEYFSITMQSAGSTTYRRRLKEKGVEPDECFYMQTAPKIIGKKFNPKEYPMPDVAVEIHITHGSLDKFKIYAALGVPELWIYDGNAARFYALSSDAYSEIGTSRAFPLLTSNAVTEFLEKSESEGQTAALKSFREWLKNQNG